MQPQPARNRKLAGANPAPSGRWQRPMRNEMPGSRGSTGRLRHERLFSRLRDPQGPWGTGYVPDLPAVQRGENCPKPDELPFKFLQAPERVSVEGGNAETAESMSRPKSTYQIPCECGTVVESHEPETVCAKCGRKLIVRGWGKAPERAA